MQTDDTQDYVKIGLKENGFDNINQYLRWLASEYEIPYYEVKGLFDLLGPSELFDGLVSSVQDRSEEYWG